MPAKSKFCPPQNPAPLSPGMFAAVLLGATAVGVAAMVFLFNPATHAFYPVCLFHALTGLNCPGCGMTRALYALLHGHVRLALKDNALLVLALPALLIALARLGILAMRGKPTGFDVPPKALWPFLVVALVFAVLRNLPGFGWLCP
jgi:hypothetical protein